MVRRNVDFINLGPIRSIPQGKATLFHSHGHEFAVFRETYGHCYVVDCTTSNISGEELEQGRIEGHTLRLKDGKTVDLHTGTTSGMDQIKAKVANSWVENGFIFMSLMEVINSTGLM